MREYGVRNKGSSNECNVVKNLQMTKRRRDVKLEASSCGLIFTI